MKAYEEISYVAPLSSPLTTDAFIARDDGDWRVVVLPGTPTRKGLYRRFLRTAPDGVEVVVLSRPGFGKGHTAPVLDWSEQIKAVEPFLGEKKTIALGVSYGAELALMAALEYPHDIDAVVALSPLIDEPLNYALALEKLGGAPVVKDLIPRRWARVREEIGARRAQIAPLLARLSDLQVPVEVLHGDFDGLVSRANADKLMAHLGERGRLEIVPGGTHYIELQYPKRLHRAVARAIARSEQSKDAKRVH